jgi:hypothetical protein
MKFPSLRRQNQKNNPNNQRQNNAAKTYCRFCEKDTHSEDKYFTLERVERKLITMKSRINEVQENLRNSSQNTTQPKK